MTDLLTAIEVAQLAPSCSCEHCGKPFEPRAGSGGKPQKYCSVDCRRAADAQRDQRAPTRSAENGTDDIREPTPTERRSMLIEATKEFDAKMGTTAEQAVDNAVAAGRISLAPPPADADEFSWCDDESVVLPDQQAVAVYFNPAGELVIRQKQWPGDDQFIYIGPAFQNTFIDKLTDAMGIPSFGGPQPKPAPVRK